MPADMAVYSRAMAADNSEQLGRLRRNLLRALREDVTEKQRQVLLLYYSDGLNMRQISERLGVNKSTVSRTIKRGETPSAPLPAVWRRHPSGPPKRVRAGKRRLKWICHPCYTTP